MHHLRCTCAYVHITEPKQLTIYLTFHNTLTFAQKMVVQCTISTTQCYFSHKLQLVNKILIQRVTLLEFQFQVRSKAKETFLGVCFLCSLYISRLARYYHNFIDTKCATPKLTLLQAFGDSILPIMHSLYMYGVVFLLVTRFSISQAFSQDFESGSPNFMWAKGPNSMAPAAPCSQGGLGACSPRKF